MSEAPVKAAEFGKTFAAIWFATAVVAFTLAFSSSGAEAPFLAANLVLAVLLILLRSSFLVNFHLFVLTIAFLVPAAFGVFSPDAAGVLAPSNSAALEYILKYNYVFVVAFLLLTNDRGRVRSLSADKPLPLLPLLCMFGFALVCATILQVTHSFRVLDQHEVSPFTGVLSSMMQTGIVLPLLLIGLRSISRDRASMHSYVAVALVGVMLGFLSGSRWFLVEVVLIVLLVEFERNRRVGLLLIAAVTPMVLVIIPFMGFYRRFGYDAGMAAKLWQMSGFDWYHIAEALFEDRFNYLRIVRRVIEFSPYVPMDYRPYLDNIIGVIPRLLWSDKPMIGMDLNLIGKQLSIISQTDNATSIGLSVMGESYYLLRGYGVVVGAFQAVLFALLERTRNLEGAFWRAFYVAITFVLAVRDSYLYIVPTLIMSVIVFLLFERALKFLPPDLKSFRMARDEVLRMGSVGRRL